MTAATLFERRRLLRRDVELFRAVSKRARSLKEGRQGSVVNPLLRLQHSNAMREIVNRLEMLGHKEIARLLSQWHHHLELARGRTGSAYARHQRLLAREITGEINRKIEATR